jgi:hypothetical protein
MQYAAVMALELVALPSSVVFTGPEAVELIVAYRVDERMSDVAIGVLEHDDEIIVRVEAGWKGLESSAGAFAYLTYASSRVALECPVGARRVRAVPDSRHSPGIC